MVDCQTRWKVDKDMNSRKDYKKAVELIKEEVKHWEDTVCAGTVKLALVCVFIKFFRQDNPRFDEARFRSAIEN